MDKILELIKFDDKGLIPSIIQDEKTKEVLTLCYMNRDALLKTLEAGKIYVFRRSKGRLMLKGETSGCTQAVKSLAIDCEGNSLLFMVDQERAACHEGYFTCYFRRLKKDGQFEIIGKRIFDPKTVYNQPTR
ncbi:MAG: phosphoribosyl-AMP cyclohydrolase [Candidatus Omnitrophica bacterium]|jgi:phosphoribosyl-AMP cyclohydrolase|nr:phosphoribosyl-AMP cyclohydrolase [Candidatus Omnitrophota bacterium]